MLTPANLKTLNLYCEKWVWILLFPSELIILHANGVSFTFKRTFSALCVKSYPHFVFFGENLINCYMK